jgi:mono/diheme cytochrome c family protein
MARFYSKVLAVGASVGLAAMGLWACSSQPSKGSETTSSVKVDFDRQVRPILSAHCFSCHGPDDAARQANLRVDTAAGVLEPRGSRPAVVVPGDAKGSLLYQRITSAETPMPPADANKALSKDEIATLRAWIEGGAKYPDRWFLVAPTRPEVPVVEHASWVKNPIDAFVAEKLEAAGLEPAPEAEPRALIRRVTLALTGLPPAPEDVERFAANHDDAAYGALVDSLLQSPTYGEQRAHYWLDAARYADTHGFHQDDYRSIWPYRDWVIAAFNADKPFDEFTLEQLAGDLIPNATPDQIVGTGFIRSGMSTYEGGSIAAEVAAATAKERVETLGKVWLGLTAGCAACHDHKFDPISQREFYELTAFFRNSTEGVFDLNLPNPPPIVTVNGTDTLVTGEATTTPSAQVLARGDYQQPGDTVGADVPAALPPLPAGEPHNRLGLAHWLLSPEHPLTSRVTANRFWSELFGIGIVATAHDFGSTGDPPSNQELLDWLAVEFRESGWDVRALMRLMVTSATYRQSAAVTADKLTVDPENRLLSRGPRFRMDAELVRDLALSASGLLVSQIGGASVKPYQPAGLWESVGTPESNTNSYVEDSGPSLYRRSLYTFWKRQAPPPSLQIFDAPTREISVVRRERTNTPLQPLVTMNDEQFVEAARQLAALALAAAPETPDRLDFMAKRVISRPLASAETTLLTNTLSTLLAQYGAAPDQASALLGVGESPINSAAAPVELAAWTMLASTILNLDEALNQ